MSKIENDFELKTTINSNSFGRTFYTIKKEILCKSEWKVAVYNFLIFFSYSILTD